jgi:hypothetical protein
MEFTSVPSSGGLRWKKTENITGDVVCTHKDHHFPFSVEVKFHRSLDLEKMIRNNVKCTVRDEFWKQCLQDSQRNKRIPMLLMRYNGLPRNFFYVLMRYGDAKLFKVLSPEFRKNYLKSGSLIITHTEFLQSLDYRVVEQKLIAKLISEYGEETQ